MSYFKKQIESSINIKSTLFEFEKQVNWFSDVIYYTIKKGGKVFLCGNGGSAADAQHLAAEFLIRLNPKINRPALPMISLALDTSSLTACGNDYSFDKIYSRNLEALGLKNDLLICISTSGNSKNIINVIKCANKKKIKILCLLGKGGGKVKKMIKKNKNSIVIPSNDTARIQECHIFLGHVILNIVERNIIKNKTLIKKLNR